MTETSEKIELPVLEYIPLITSCRECVFAEKWGGHQTGCEFQRIDKFKNNGGVFRIQEKWIKMSDLVDEKFIEMEDISLDEYNNGYGLSRYKDGVFEGLVAEITKNPDYHDEKTYYEIPRYCDKCRDGVWENNNKGENLKDKAIKESRLRIAFLIVLNPKSTFLDLDLCIEEIEKQSFRAHEIIVLNGGATINRDDISKLLKKTDIDHYRYIKPLVKELEYGLLEAYRQTKGKWLIEIHNCECPRRTLASELDDMLNEQLERCIMWKISPNITAFQKKVIIEYSKEGIIQKAKDDKVNYLIKNDIK